MVLTLDEALQFFAGSELESDQKGIKTFSMGILQLCSDVSFLLLLAAFL